jgi:hypothetical protein
MLHPSRASWLLRFASIASFLFVSLIIPPLTRADTILYDTTNLSIGFGTVVSTSPSNQLGNEINLIGTTPVAQLVTEFNLFYQGFVPLPGQQLNGQGDVTLRFWTGDASPNLIYQSAAFPILSGSLGIQELVIDNLHVVVPRNFIWTAQFGGISSGYNTPGGLAPVTGTVVGSEIATWTGPAGGPLSLFSTNYVFEATVKGTPLGTSVPIPSTAVSFAFGMLSLTTLQRLRRS